MTDGKLFSGQALLPEQTLVSPGGHARLHYQIEDGNCVTYKDGNPYWASHTDGYLPAGKLHMDPNGNCVIWAGGKPIASTRTEGHPRAMIQLQDDGDFVLYEDPNGPLAGTPIWSSRTGAFVIGDCVVTPPSEDWKIAGTLRFINQGRDGVADDNGQRNVVGLHCGSLLSEAFHFGWAGVEEALDYCVYRHFPFFRSWTNLPAPEWWGVPPRPGTFSIKDGQAHWDIIDGLVDRALARGLRWLVSQGDLIWLLQNYWGNDPSKLYGYMAELGTRLQRRGGANALVLGVDAGNEAWNFTRCTDTTLMGGMLNAFLNKCPCPIRSMTSAPDEGQLNLFDASPTSLTDKHGSRDTVRMAFERAFTAGYWDGKTWPYLIDSECPGCGPKVSATNHPEQWMERETMGMLVLINLLAHGIPVMMSSPGVYLRGETFMQYDEQLSVGPMIAELLPRDIQSWRLFHGGDDRSFSPDRILRAPAVPGNYRCDHARSRTDPSKYGVAVYQNDPGGPIDVEAINGFEGEIWHPGTLERSPIRFNKGERVHLDFRRGRFLLGRRTS